VCRSCSKTKGTFLARPTSRRFCAFHRRPLEARCRHSGETTRRPPPATRLWWWWWWLMLRSTVVLSSNYCWPVTPPCPVINEVEEKQWQCLVGCVMPKARQQLHRQRKNDGRVLFCRDLCQSLQVAELQCWRWLADDIRSILESTRRSELAFSRNHLQVTRYGPDIQTKDDAVDWTDRSTVYIQAEWRMTDTDVVTFSHRDITPGVRHWLPTAILHTYDNRPARVYSIACVQLPTNCT